MKEGSIKMNYLTTLQNDLKTSMKERDKDRTRTIRALISKLKEKRIEINQDLSKEEELRVLTKAAKERKESAATYRNAQRDDLAEVEEKEFTIIEAYLPAQMDENEILEVVKKIISESGAAGMKDIGKVMGPAMKALSGKADGKIVQTCVKKLLG